MSQITREEFRALVIKRVGEKFPLVKISAEEGGFSVLVNGQQAGLENLYRLVSLHPQETSHHVDRWMVELLRFSEGSPDQSAEFGQIKDRIYPMILAKNDLKTHPGILFDSVLENLIVSYVVDSPQTVAYVPRAQLPRWKMTLEELHAVAMENLVKRSEAVAAHAAQDEEGKINLVLFQTMDGYDATRILLPTLHDRLREMLGSPFAAAIPNRDILLCFRNDPQTVERLHSQIKADYKRMPHQVTEQLLLVTADGIAARDEGGK
jgi:hypothetical protein